MLDLFILNFWKFLVLWRFQGVQKWKNEVKWVSLSKRFITSLCNALQKSMEVLSRPLLFSSKSKKFGVTIMCKIYWEFTRFRWKSWFEVKVQRCFLAIFNKITIKWNFWRKEWILGYSWRVSFPFTQVP